MSLLRFSLPSPVYSSSLRSQSHYLSPVPSQRSVSPLPISHVSASVLPNVAPRLHFLRRLSDLSFPHPCPMTVNSSILSIGEKPKKKYQKNPKPPWLCFPGIRDRVSSRLANLFHCSFHGNQPNQIALVFRHPLYAFSLSIFTYAFLSVCNALIFHHCLSDTSYTWGTAQMPCFHKAFPSCFKEQCAFLFRKKMLFYFCFCT